jgi:hypothetical protein
MLARVGGGIADWSCTPLPLRPAIESILARIHHNPCHSRNGAHSVSILVVCRTSRSLTLSNVVHSRHPLPKPVGYHVTTTQSLQSSVTTPRSLRSSVTTPQSLRSPHHPVTTPRSHRHSPKPFVLPSPRHRHALDPHIVHQSRSLYRHHYFTTAATTMADQQEVRFCNKCRNVLPLANFPKPVRPCIRCRERAVRKQYEQAIVMNRSEPSPTASLQVNMDLSPSLVPCFRALVFALAINILALAYAHVAGTF